VNIDGVQGFSHRQWCWWPVGGEQGPQQSVVKLGVEDRKPQPVAGEPVQILAGDSGDDEPVAGSLPHGYYGTSVPWCSAPE